MRPRDRWRALAPVPGYHVPRAAPFASRCVFRVLGFGGLGVGGVVPFRQSTYDLKKFLNNVLTKIRVALAGPRAVCLGRGHTGGVWARGGSPGFPITQRALAPPARRGRRCPPTMHAQWRRPLTLAAWRGLEGRAPFPLWPLPRAWRPVMAARALASSDRRGRIAQSLLSRATWRL